MEKQNKKEEMGYTPKPIQKMCSNCSHFSSVFEKTEYGYMQEKELRCSIGGFAVKKQGNCNIHEFKK